MKSQRALCYRAGPAALRVVRSEGFDPSLLRGFVAPASGPKWLTIAGIDRAIMASGLLQRASAAEGHRPLLIGASAGGWRVLVLACGDAENAHRELEARYVGMVFPRGVGKAEITRSYRRMLTEIFTEQRVAWILGNPCFDVAVHVARARGPWASRNRWIQGAAMVAAAGLDGVSARTQKAIFERLLFHTEPDRWIEAFDGRVLRLDKLNLHQVALATGTVPLYFEPVAEINGAGRGAYVDGGMMDYHLNQPVHRGSNGLVLFPHFQERIVPQWFDRYFPWRRPKPEVIDHVLQLFPSPDFVSALPGGRIPTRQDFIEFADRPERRIARWQRVCGESDRLGEQLLDDVEHGRIPELVLPIS